MTNLADELERLAKEATPEKFYVSSFEINAGGKNRMIMGGDGFSVAYISGRSEAENAADAALIVALRNALPQILSALRGEQWQGIETAPKGVPSPDAGCRQPSEWFLAGRPGRKTLVVRRRAWPQDDGWEDQPGNHYAPGAFTHWRPLPPPPKGTTHD